VGLVAIRANYTNNLRLFAGILISEFLQLILKIVYQFFPPYKLFGLHFEFTKHALDLHLCRNLLFLDALFWWQNIVVNLLSSRTFNFLFSFGKIFFAIFIFRFNSFEANSLEQWGLELFNLLSFY